MNYIPLVGTIIVLSLWSCKNDTSEKDTDVLKQTVEQPEIKESVEDSILPAYDRDLEKLQSITLKQKELQTQPDESDTFENLIIEKKVVKEEDLYTLDFNYPLLNENIQAGYRNFNDYINHTYVDVLGTEASILEDAALICDTIRTNRFHERRTIDYKIYNLNDKLISILFYKENFYARTIHPSLSFTCLNFDLNRAVFMKYEDIFSIGSEEEMRAILNNQITDQIAAGELYYDCWELSSDEFFRYKNNFVLNDEYAEFYFDDCVICPSYTGTYSIKVPLEKLLPVLRQYRNNPFKG